MITKTKKFKILAPAVLFLGIFCFATFGLFLPSLQNALIERKREVLKEITNSALSVLSHYHERVVAGELDIKQAQADAIAIIHDLRYGPDSKDYVWINNLLPEMVMHPYRPDLNGKDLSNIADPNGTRPFVEAVRLVRLEGGGYIDYMWQWKDNPSQIVPKLSYVTAFKPWSWIIGTGMYTEDVEREIATITSEMKLVSIGMLVLVTLLSVYAISHATKVDARRRKAEKELAAHQEQLEDTIKIRTAELMEHREHLAEIVERKTADLQESNIELQREVADRKRVEAELHSKIAEITEAKHRLDVLVSSVIDRENKMLDLKQEINSLLERLGENKKYKAPEQVEEFHQCAGVKVTQ